MRVSQGVRPEGSDPPSKSQLSGEPPGSFSKDYKEKLKKIKYIRSKL
jgi:hypothetical protein